MEIIKIHKDNQCNSIGIKNKIRKVIFLLFRIKKERYRPGGKRCPAGNFTGHEA